MIKTHSLPAIKEDTKQDLLASYCRALGHPVRVEIVKLLLNRGACISGDIADHFDKAHSTVSEHLRILRKADLVLGTIDGPKRCYCANPKALNHIKQLINLLAEHPGCCLPMTSDKERT